MIDTSEIKGQIDFRMKYMCFFLLEQQPQFVNSVYVYV